MILKHKFVEFIPKDLEDGVIYISMEYATAIHNCICGCGYQVVTPFSPKDWQLKFDGETITLSPSIGNWSSECKSHYFIRNSKVELARKFSEWEIKDVRKKEKPPRKKKGSSKKPKK
jgi:hypothetical protein